MLASTHFDISGYPEGKGGVAPANPSSVLHTMFDIAHFVMSGLHLRIATLDQDAHLGRKRPVTKSILELGLGMIFTGLDLVDDRLVVMPSNHGLQIEEHAMRAGESGAVVFCLTTETRNDQYTSLDRSGSAVMDRLESPAIGIRC